MTLNWKKKQLKSSKTEQTIKLLLPKKDQGYKKGCNSQKSEQTDDIELEKKEDNKQ